jgi:hypothetical protein
LKPGRTWSPAQKASAQHELSDVLNREALVDDPARLGLHRLLYRRRGVSLRGGLPVEGDEVAKQLAVAACVQQFLVQPDRGVIYTERKGTTSSYQRRQLIQKNQWATDREVADLCDQRIQAFDASVFEPLQELPGEAAASKQPA